MNNKKIYDFLINILLKKAEGYYYTEEQEDYEKTQNKTNSSNIQFENISFFQNNDTLKTKSGFDNDNIEPSNETQKKQTNQNLTMVKKKITKHYIPPDMVAIKILFETIKEKVNDDELNNISDDELIKLKNKLAEELLNENK